MRKDRNPIFNALLDVFSNGHRLKNASGMGAGAAIKMVAV